MDPLKLFSEKTRLAYELAAEKYHDLFRSELEQKPYDRAVLDVFAGRLSRGSIVCDAGCGPAAHIGRHLHDLGMRVIGLDLSERCVKIAKKANPGMRFRCEDIAAMSFPDGVLDGIVSCHSVIHTPKAYVPLLFKEFHRVLKPKGLLLTVVKAGASEGYQDELLGIEAEIYFSLFTEAEIADYYSRAGFTLSFLERRSPYDFEFKVDRLYAIGSKKD
ncbi:MAG: class I SAM-dependent methyltransferase [Candidatus Aminicenantes bacterium]|nr:class I SAM-dependent methyltransferase [Candidatus Aminicenantes bacterium]